MGPWVNHAHWFLSSTQMLYRLHYYCTWWTPLPGMITHLSAKQAKDRHQHLPAGLLPLLCYTCSPWGTIWGRREETLLLVYLRYFNPSCMDSGEWGTLSFSGVGDWGSSCPLLLHHLVSLSWSKWGNQGCPTALSCSSTAPHHHDPTNEWAGKQHRVWKPACSIEKSVVKVSNYLSTVFSFASCKLWCPVTKY